MCGLMQYYHISAAVAVFNVRVMNTLEMMITLTSRHHNYLKNECTYIRTMYCAFVTGRLLSL